MTSHLVTGIGELVTHDPRFDGPLLDAALVAEDGVRRLGRPARRTPRPPTAAPTSAAPRWSRASSTPTPTWSSRATGPPSSRPAWPAPPYTGGGIATTVAATRAASDDDAARAPARRWSPRPAPRARRRSRSRAATASTSRREERLLRLAREVTPETTFLGAHVVPPGVDRADYVALVTGPMLAACAPHARWADVFCEPASPVAFDGDEAREVLVAAAAAGLGLRVHGNQLGHGPGVQLAVELGAASVDHCTYLTDADVAALAGSDTVATLLPGVEFSTRSPVPGRPPPARRGRRGRAGQRLQPRHLLLDVDAADDRARRPRDADDGRRGGPGGHARRRARPASRRRRPPARSARAPTWPCSTPRATATWPTARASRSPAALTL